jgi:hypothetical protein
MNRETHIIEVYLTIQSACRAVSGGNPLRRRGPAARLTDAEILTIEIFGEMQGHHDDAAIWRYAKAHWQEWFPGLGSYPPSPSNAPIWRDSSSGYSRICSRPSTMCTLPTGAPMPI